MQVLQLWAKNCGLFIKTWPLNSGPNICKSYIWDLDKWLLKTGGLLIQVTIISDSTVLVELNSTKINNYHNNYYAGQLLASVHMQTFAVPGSPEATHFIWRWD